MYNGDDNISQDVRARKIFLFSQPSGSLDIVLIV